MIYVMMPAYNEGAKIGGFLKNLDNVLKNNGYRYTVIVCDDGSRDNTAQVLRECQEHMPVRIVTHPQNRGVGQAFVSIFREAYTASSGFANDSDVFVLMEADGSSDVSILASMIEKVSSGCDVICASRLIKGGGFADFPARRLMLSVAANTLLRLRFPIKGVTDYTIFYRAYSAGILKKTWEKYGEELIKINGFAGNAELLIKMRPSIRKADEVSHMYRYGKDYKSSNLKVAGTIKEYFNLFMTKV